MQKITPVPMVQRPSERGHPRLDLHLHERRHRRVGQESLRRAREGERFCRKVRFLGAVPLSRERFFDVPLAHQPGRKDAL